MSIDAATALSAAVEAWRRGDPDAAREVVAKLAPAEQVQLGIALYNERELDLLAAVLSEDFVHDMRPTGLPGMGVYHGRAAYRRFMEEWLDAFSDSHVVIESIEEAGDRVLAVIAQQMSGAGSGVPVSFRYASVTTHERGGQAIASEFHTDLERARARFEELTG